MQTDPVATPDVGAGTRWSIMVVSLLATASSFLFINGVAFLIPSLQGARGIRLDEAGLLASMPSWEWWSRWWRGATCWTGSASGW